MSEIYSPSVPYNGPIVGGMFPGRIVRVQGTVPGNSHKFAVNLLCTGSGDIALHVSPHFQSHHVVRNFVQHMSWGVEEKQGGIPIHPGQQFELLILCEPASYKIAFNGAHFAEFHHRIPYQNVTNVAVDGQVLITRISYEGGATGGYAPPMAGGFAPPTTVPHAPVPPYPAGGAHVPHGVGPYPAAPGVHGVPHYPTQPTPTPHYPAQIGVHGTPHYPHQPGVHGTPHYPHQPGVPMGTPHYPTQPGYPGSAHMTPNSTSYPHSPTGHKKTGFLDKAGMAVAGALGASTLMGGGHKYNKLGGGLGPVLAGAAMTGHLSPKKAMKKQAKAQKKALKYGLPIAGVGLGAYALHKGVHKLGHHGHHGHHRSSSSSSSSSSD